MAHSKMIDLSNTNDYRTMKHKITIATAEGYRNLERLQVRKVLQEPEDNMNDDGYRNTKD